MKCKRCKKQTEPGFELCHTHIEALLETLEPKFPWTIGRNGKKVASGTTSRHVAYGQYAKHAAGKGFTHWLWKEEHYTDDKGNTLTLTFDRVYKRT